MSRLRLLATALTFLTRLPVARFAYPDELSLARSARYFPLVGVIVGAIGAAIFALCSLAFAPFVSAALTIGALVIVTGAFHEDGLADTADGLGGGMSVERKLEIMKDSRIGSYGAAALVLSLLLRIGALMALAPAVAGVALIIAHTLARTSSLWLTLALPYVRMGSNKPMADALGWSEVIEGTAWAAAICAVASWWYPATVVAALMAIGVAWLAGQYFRAQLGGITGDTLGAANQTVEIAVMLSFAALL